MAPLATVGAAIALAVNAICVVVILMDLRSEGSTVPDKVDWKSDLSLPVGNAGSQKSIENYKQILAKPVFFKSREPFVPAASPSPVIKKAPSVSVADPNLVLGGVMIESRLKRVYLFQRGNPSGAWVSEGEEFMGWQVHSIDGMSAKLEQKDLRIYLQLYPKD